VTMNRKDKEEILLKMSVRQMTDAPDPILKDDDWKAMREFYETERANRTPEQKKVDEFFKGKFVEDPWGTVKGISMAEPDLKHRIWDQFREGRSIYDLACSLMREETDCMLVIENMIRECVLEKKDD